MGLLRLGEQEGQILTQLLESERLVIHRRIDAEAAGVGAAQAPDHRHDLDRGRLLECGLHEFPARSQRRQIGGLPRRRNRPAHWPMRLAFLQDFLDDRPVGEAQDVVEVLLRVLGIAAGVRSAEHRDGSASAEKIAERVGELGRLGECADEQHIEIVGELGEKILPARVAEIADIVTRLLAPHAEDLRHDTGEAGVHQPAVQAVARTLGDQVEDADDAPAGGKAWWGRAGRGYDHESPSCRRSALESLGPECGAE